MAYPIMAPSNTWYKTSVLRSTITEINIVDSYTPTGNETETWNADVDNSGSIKCYLNGTVLTIAGNGSGKIALNEDSSYLFHSGISDASNVFLNCTAINGLELFDASNASDISRAFAYCIALKELDLSSWDVSNVTSLRYTFASHESVGPMSLETLNLSGWNITNKCTLIRTTFQNCANLTELDVSNWDTSGCTDMSYAFYNCAALTTIGDVSNWDVSKVTDMRSMFYNCASLSTITVSNWRTSACTNMQNMFAKCTALTELDVSNWDVSKVTNFNSMFAANDYGTNPSPITSLDVSNWDVSSATDMGWMFYGLRNLKTLDLGKWGVSKVESFHHCFAWCTSLVITGLENWDVRSAKTLNAMFHGNKTTSYDLSGWNVSNCESFGQMFEENHALVEIKGLENWNTSKGKNFYEMFRGCNILKELNLSSFDTRNASDSWVDPQRGEAEEYGGMSQMFGISSESSYFYLQGMPSLEKITLGENFSFNGDGTCYPALLPTQTQEYIPNTDGYWHTVEGAAYASANIPNMTANTYYCADPVWLRDYLVKGETLSAIADAIRAGNGTTERYLPTNYANAISNIAEGAKNAATDAFWDIIQNKGKRTDYNRAFRKWDCEYIRPKYKIRSDAEVSFGAGFVFEDMPNLKKVEAAYFDFSNEKLATDINNVQYGTFGYCYRLEEVEDVGFRPQYIQNRTYHYCHNLKTIAVVRSAEFTQFMGTFYQCYKLENLTIEGVIAKNGFDVQYSTLLSKASITSIINALSTTTTGLTVTLSKTAVNNAFETSEGAADGSTSEEWATLAGTKSNWTISLV